MINCVKKVHAVFAHKEIDYRQLCLHCKVFLTIARLQLTSTNEKFTQAISYDFLEAFSLFLCIYIDKTL